MSKPQDLKYDEEFEATVKDVWTVIVAAQNAGRGNKAILAAAMSVAAYVSAHSKNRDSRLIHVFRQMLDEARLNVMQKQEEDIKHLTAELARAQAGTTKETP